MIVSESDTLVAALDRRLAVDRILALDPLGAVDPEARQSATAKAPAGPVPPPSPTMRSAAAAVTSLEPGAVVAARVVDAPAPDHLLVDVGRMRIALAWPAVNGPPPTIGRDVTLRVVADAPMLVFETLRDDGADTARIVAPSHLSADALRLQGSSNRSNAPTRFSAPILTLHATDANPSVATTGDAGVATASPADVPTVTAPSDESRTAPLVLPLVLQGPAWPGQAVELVVRRERADEAFDNAALDQWCGEIVIELPRLGRVSGHLAWSLQGLRVRVEGADAASTASLSAATAELAAALLDADLPIVAVTVGLPVAASPDGGRRG